MLIRCFYQLAVLTIYNLLILLLRLQLQSELQSKVRNYIFSKQRRLSDGNGNIAHKSEGKTIKVPITTFPPTAMVYSLSNGNF